MAQNIYDDKNFFREYIKLPRQAKGLDGAGEWPSFRSLIPDVDGSNVLDLGCGFGWLCRWARENGAKGVLGVDLSENMLSEARKFPQDLAISYQRADLDTLQLPPNTYDVAVSSLTLHYLKNLPGFVAQVYQSLRPGGSFVFSAEHPIYTSPRNPRFVKDQDGHDVWQLEGYLYEGPRTTNWIAEGVVKQHRTIGTYISIFLDAGFTLSAIDEWGPSAELIKEEPSLVENLERPIFFLMKLTKPT